MSFLKEPKRTVEGKVDIEWWNSLSVHERGNYNVHLSEIQEFEDKKSPTEIIIKPELLDTSSLEEGDGSSAVWRPSEFSEYIGQEKLKMVLQAYINGCNEQEKTFPHMLIDGKAGTGKTTIAYLLAKKLNKKFVERVATTIKSQQQFVDLLVEVDGGILFIDEIQAISDEVAEFMLPTMEDFQISGKRIKQFTLFGCTTEKGSLLKRYKPLVDRFKIQKTLDDYTEDEMCKLISQFHKKSFPKSNVPDDVIRKISGNCRLTPRIALRYLESFIFMNTNIETVFESYNIIKDGFTTDDVKVLEILNDNEKAVGLQAIASYLGTSEENYMYTNEGYLLQKGLITRLPRGRTITEKGKKFLEDIK